MTCTASSAQCGGGSCANGIDTPPVFCNQAACPSVSTMSCSGNLACNAGSTACLAGPCHSDGDCQSGYFCGAGGACQVELAPGAKCNLTTDCNGQSGCHECASGYCVDGYCCDQACNGQCQACDGATPGKCAAVSGAPHGTQRAACGGSGVCAGACNGSDVTKCAFPTVQCAPQTCSNDTITFASTCSQGSCVAPTPATQACTSGQICSGNSCNGCTLDSQCAANQYCDNTGACKTRKGPGTACGLKGSSNGDCYANGNCAECQSGNCVDGWCCNTPCNGQCQNCSANPGSCQDTGSTANPIQPITSLGTTRAACPGSGSCQLACNGTSAACVDAHAGQQCRAPSCSGDTGTLAAACSGGSCPGVVTQSCGAYQCSGAACLGGCTQDSDCQPGNYCDNSGQCQTQRIIGRSCALTTSGTMQINPDCYGQRNCAECQSGNCITGVCCNSTCSDFQQCQTCLGDGTHGLPAGQCDNYGQCDGQCCPCGCDPPDPLTGRTGCASCP
jgi:hypothetical protein